MDAGALNRRAAIDRATRRGESACVTELLAEFSTFRYDREAAVGLARRLVEAVRRQRHGHGGIDHLMQEFSLSTREGVALMCLAEALLRIPDAATADRLIRDKLAHGDWRAHLGGSPSLFVNAATWGLMIGGKLVATHGHGDLGHALSGVLARGGEPLVRKGMDFAMRLLGEQFVIGEDIGAALTRAAKNAARGYRHSFDMLGEAALTAADAARYGAAYEAAIHAIGAAAAGRGPIAGPGISIKLSALHPRYVRAQRERVMAELLPRLKTLMRLARDYGIGVNIDAEESERLMLSLELLEALAADADLAGWDGLGFVVQAYQKRSPLVVAHLVALARRSGRRLMVRLVKGAYWDSEIKRAQVEGLADYPVFTRKAHTDLGYLVCAARLLDAHAAVYPQFATHNAHTVATLFEMARARGVEDYEFQCLHGMGEPLYDHVVGAAGLGKPCRIYAPVGTHETLLPYLVRRLLENGANSSFVNRLVDPAVAVESLLDDPAERARRDGGSPHPKIRRPPDIYGAARSNSAGIDLASDSEIARFEQAFAALEAELPFVAGGEDAEAAAVEAALAAAQAGAAAWHARGAAERAALLLRAADLFEAERERLMRLCIREAGKTWPSAVAEVREAADYCRYYAQQARAGRLVREPPGVFACLSPWNFPLAIFVGQVAAALAAGAAVVAKPAEQTPRVAAFAVELLRRAGVPESALQLLPGRGERVGAALVADRRVCGVLFTGSTAVAQSINRTLAGRGDREVRLVAETGGQNAMIVDSSALPEQVVQDVLASAFDSAGQRCSALRVLCLQEEIAERVLAMLRAAMAELRVGDPMRLATDVGPVIDEEARGRLLDHIARMRAAGRAVFQPPLPSECARGCFVAPTLIEIGALGELTGEVFGPVLHVLRYAGERIDALIADINATGYGLTLGVHSRIDETVARVVAGARVGNVYVNRNMIGAVVGVQPFGGEGLSGTGPKAGGPLMLPRLTGAENLHPAEIGGRRHAGELPPPLRQLAAWAEAAGHLRLAQACADYGAATLLDTEVELPGPTGERNTLRFAPRGDFLCLAGEADELLEQVAAALASGNRPVFAATELHERVARSLPEALALRSIGWRSGKDFHGLAGVLFAGAAAELARMRRLVAAADGPLLPVVAPGAESGRYPLYRMLVERVVSINTAAAGGNTALMTLGA